MSEKAPDYIETEQKFVPLLPERLDTYRKSASKIVQIYLSHPDEEFSLRIREQTADSGDVSYIATLKDTGQWTDKGLRRREFNAEISREQFDFYQTGAPVIEKYRAEPHDNIVIDFFEDGYIHAESEDPESWQQFISDNNLQHDFVELTDDRLTSNEWRAHELYKKRHRGREAFAPKPEHNIDEIVDDILRARIMNQVTIVQIGGRSGSGKTTFVKKIQERLEQYLVPSTILSTDDYNRGKAYLYKIGGGDWQDFDSDTVYDLPGYATDLQQLRRGKPINRRRFDPVSEETVIDGTIDPQFGHVILGEGIKANHADISDFADLTYEVPTSLATSLGRRILRDLVERPRFADPTTNISYYLKYTEPAYRARLQNS